MRYWRRPDAAIDKIRRNELITADDVAELQRVLVESGLGSKADLDRARAEAGSIGLFIRRLVGLDRSAAKTSSPPSSTTSATTPT